MISINFNVESAHNREEYCDGYARTTDLHEEFECFVAKIRMTRKANVNVVGGGSAKSRGQFTFAVDDHRRASFVIQASV